MNRMKYLNKFQEIMKIMVYIKISRTNYKSAKNQ